MHLDSSKEKIPYRDRAMVIAEPAVPVSYAVVCDAPIEEASAWIPRLDTAITMSTSFSEDRKTFYFTWRTPHRGAIWVHVFSMEEIHIRHISPALVSESSLPKGR
jgi:hypothetical protein